MRTVICHYHIYKNSGTTFDGILGRNFGEAHVCFDGPFPYFSISQRELLRIIERNPAAKAFSSHQITLPVPTSLDILVLPVVFVRHPILRIHSVYRFKRAEQDGTETSRNAGEMTFDEWCRHCLAHPREVTHVSNAQTRMLGGVHGDPSPLRRGRSGMLYDLQQARRNLNNVDLLARTEYFDRDVGRFPGILKRHGIDFAVEDTTPLNVTTSDFAKSVEERVADVREALDDETYDALRKANAQDLELYDQVCERLR